MPFVPRQAVKRPKPVGRPPRPIPAELRAILDQTFSEKSAYTDDVTDMDRDDLRELLKLGTLYAERRGLSFRSRETEDDDGRVTLAMWIQPKNSYTRKVAA
jgi:hypothetical protein